MDPHLNSSGDALITGSTERRSDPFVAAAWSPRGGEAHHDTFVKSLPGDFNGEHEGDTALASCAKTLCQPPDPVATALRMRNDK